MITATSNTDGIKSTDRTAIGRQPDGTPVGPPPPTVPVGANPATAVGLTAANGVATSFMRSDGAPALSQAIAPTWSALHTFQVGLTTTATTVAALPAVAMGKRAFVTDALGPAFGAAVVGGGAVAVPVYSDGVGWFVG